MPEAPSEETGWDDFDRIVAALNKYRVDFLIIGGFAVIYHGYVRDTEDLDIFIRRTPENARAAVAALEEAGFGCPELTPEVFTADNGIALGEKPVRVDILSVMRGVTFEEAWKHKETSAFGQHTVNFLSYDHLLANKRAAGRPQDLADVHVLELGRKEAAQEKESDKEDGREL